jgi:hypothetical protein
MKYLIKKLLRESLLNEGASPILYHFTNVNKVINILSTNTFYLTSNIGTPADQIAGDKAYYMSFSRSKSVKQGYGTKFTFNGAARIKIDGQKLTQNYKVKSIDYWQYPKTPDMMKQLSGDEMEDRLISDNDEIPNANKYIISIDILTEPDKTVKQKLIDLAKELNIKIYFFNNEKDFASGLPKRSVEPNMVDNDEENSISDYAFKLDVIIGALTYKNPDKYQEVLNTIGNEWKGKIDEYHKKLNYYLRPNDSYYLSEITTTLNYAIHNARSNSNKLLRYAIKELALDMRKNNSKTIKDYLTHKIYIGKKTQQDYNKELNDKIQNIIDKTFNEQVENLNYSVYDQENRYENLLQFQPAKNFLSNKVKEIKKYVADYTLNNKDMFKYSYLLSSNEIKDKLNLTDNNPEAVKIANLLQDIQPNQLIRPLEMIIYMIDDFYYHEVKRMQKEEMEQW